MITKTTDDLMIGSTFSLSTHTESSIETSADKERGYLHISLFDGTARQTIKRQYPISFIHKMNGSKKWGADDLTRLLVAIYIIDPKGLTYLTRAPRIAVASLINTYREHFTIKGTLFYLDMELTMDQLSIKSQRDPNMSVLTSSVRELTRTALIPLLRVGQPV